MRIIRGSHKGRKIFPPKNFNSRPTTDFAKESLFNILENSYYFEELTVLDLFSGSGNISIEFLSRGCKSVTSVELNKKNCNHIEKQIEKLFPTSDSDVINSDVYEFCKHAGLNYKVIFADPPFSDKNIHLLAELIFNNKSISETLFILEHSEKNNFKTSPYFKETRRYGNVNFTFFEKK
jgi:16S rRNA (guanine(966)-N(2))-methyltransferase RsmD